MLKFIALAAFLIAAVSLALSVDTPPAACAEAGPVIALHCPR